MTKEQAHNLLVYLCPLLPYGLKIDREWTAPMTGSPEHATDEFTTFDIEILSSWLDEEQAGLCTCDNGNLRWVRRYSCKPYLRPMSSMTELEKSELKEIASDNVDKWCEATTPAERWKLTAETDYKSVDYYNSHYLDYRGLIDLGIALPAPENMYEIKD